MVSILVAGDFCPKNRVAEFIEKGDYKTIFGEIKPIVSESDYSIVNFECPVRTTQGSAIKKAGPSLKCSAKSVDALKSVGFNCATLANNHFYDQGEEGVKETIETLSRAGLSYVGGGSNLDEASRTLYQTVKGKILAIINCCEHEFSIATDVTGGSNPLEPITQYYAIQEARQKADYVLVIVHGGIEHFQYPSQRMVDTYRFFIDAGADAVVNHHQHCYSGHEIYKGKPIFYGLGNFCFDWQERGPSLWDEGFMVMLVWDDKGVSFKLFPYSQNNTVVGVHLKNDKEYKDWKKSFDSISEVIADADALHIKYEELLEKTKRKFSIYVTPYTRPFALSLYMRKLLPMLTPKKRLRELLNMVRCESHRERFIKMLEYFSE